MIVMEIHVPLGVAQHVRRAQLVEHLSPGKITEIDQLRVLQGFRACVVLAAETLAGVALRIEYITANDYAIIYSDDVTALQRIQCYEPPASREDI